MTDKDQREAGLAIDVFGLLLVRRLHNFSKSDGVQFLAHGRRK